MPASLLLAGEKGFLEFFDGDEVFDLLNHAKNLRRCDDLAFVVDSAKTESLHGSFLTSGAADNAAHLLDFQSFFCHDDDLL